MRKTVQELRVALGRKPFADFEKDANHRRALLVKLRTYGATAHPAITEVLAQLGHGHWKVRDAALDVLRRLEPVAAADKIIALGNTAKSCKLAMNVLQTVAMNHALWAMHFGTTTLSLFTELRRAIPVLVATLKDLEIDEFTRCDAAYALGLLGMGDDDAFAALKRSASDKSQWVRDRTAHALRYFGERAIKPLRRLRGDGTILNTVAHSLDWIDDELKKAKRAAKKATPKPTKKKPTKKKPTKKKPTKK